MKSINDNAGPAFSNNARVGKSAGCKPQFYLLALLAIIMTACEKQADLSQPVEYARDGIRFSLPGNWSVTEDVEQEGFRYLFVETPGDAIIFISSYRKEDAGSLREHVEWTIQSTIDEMPLGSRTQGSISPARRLVGQRKFDGYKNEFIASAVGFEVPHVTEFYRFDSATRSAYFVAQVAVEDLDKVSGGFDLVLSTFQLQ